MTRYDSRMKIQVRQYPEIIEKVKVLIKKDFSESVACKEVGVEFSVSQKTIYYIMNPEQKKKENEWRKKTARLRYKKEKGTRDFKDRRANQMRKYRNKTKHRNINKEE